MGNKKGKDGLPSVLEGKQEIQVDVPPGAQLLEDVCFLEFKPEDLHEGEGEGKRPYLKGRLGWADKATANKRYYPRKIMEREIKRLVGGMAEREVYGELDHPGDGKTKLARVSHFMLGAELTEDGEVTGVIEFIPGTTNGDQALAIARAGGKLGVSSRGFGSIAPDGKGNHVVQEDYRLVTWDIVADPANAGAHPKFVVEEKEITGMDLEKLKSEHPEEYARLMDEAKELVKPDARAHAREALRTEFKEQLREESEKIQEEAVEKARGELLEDPEVAGAANAMSEVKKIVAPFILGEDENSELARVRQELAEAHAIIAERDETIKEMDEENDELSRMGKEFGFSLHLERVLTGNGRKDQIVEMLGDVSEYDSLDELKARLSDISEALAEEDERQKAFEDKIAELEANNAKLEEERDQALGIGQKFGVWAYVEHKAAAHPQRNKLLSFLKESKPTSIEGVDKLVETFTASNPVSKEFQKISEGLRDGKKRGRQQRTLTEDEDGGGSLQEDNTHIGGVSIIELARRANF